MKNRLDKIYLIRLFLVTVIIAIFTSCQKDNSFENLEASFTVDKTIVEVGEQLTFTVTGDADYFVLWTGEPDGPSTSLTSETMNYTYNMPGTFTAKLLASAVNNAKDDFEVKRDSAFITITVIDNSFGEHTKFSLYRITASDFIGYEDQTISVKSTGVIEGNAVTVNVPNATNVTALKAFFMVNSNSSVFVNNVEQTSNVTENDFSQPVTYTIVSNDGTEVDNVVTVIKDDKSNAAELTEFKFSGIEHEVFMDDNQITVSVPEDSDIDSLKAIFKYSLFARAYINGIQQVSNVTENDYSSPKVFKIVAEDGTENDYTITLLSNPVFTSFSFPELTAESYYTNIENNKDTIFVIFHDDVIVTNLNTSFTTSPADAIVKIDDAVQTSGNAYIDLSSPIEYKVINGSIENNYTLSIVSSF